MSLFILCIKDKSDDIIVLDDSTDDMEVDDVVNDVIKIDDAESMKKTLLILFKSGNCELYVIVMNYLTITIHSRLFHVVSE